MFFLTAHSPPPPPIPKRKAKCVFTWACESWHKILHTEPKKANEMHIEVFGVVESVCDAVTDQTF